MQMCTRWCKRYILRSIELTDPQGRLPDVQFCNTPLLILRMLAQFMIVLYMSATSCRAGTIPVSECSTVLYYSWHYKLV